MPSQFQYSTGLRDAQLNVIETTVNASGTATLIIFGGTQPASCSVADTTPVLATITLPGAGDWLATSTGGGPVAKNVAAWTATASATGTATHFRIKGGSVCHIQGSVGTTASDMIVDNTSFNSGQSFTVNSFSIAAGNQ